MNQLTETTKKRKKPLSPFAALLYAPPVELLAHIAKYEQHVQDDRVKNTARKRRYDLKKRGSGLTRNEEQAIERDKWLAEVLHHLGQVESMTTVELGEILGTSRCTAYRRLLNMEREGHVKRTGTSVSTRWELSEKEKSK